MKRNEGVWLVEALVGATWQLDRGSPFYDTEEDAKRTAAKWEHAFQGMKCRAALYIPAPTATKPKPTVTRKVKRR